MEINISQIIKPENELEKTLIIQPELIDGLLWGEVRDGHPEGKVIYHVRDVLKNIEDYNGGWKNRRDLRIIAMVHDSFKYKVDESKPKILYNNHAILAREFLEEFHYDVNVLQVVELHDEAYNAWKEFQKDEREGNLRAERLIKDLGENLGLFLSFYKCDNCIEGKTRDNYYWFCERVWK